MLIYPKHRCFCGSDHCGPFACRFFKNAEEAKQAHEEFDKQWQTMESREADEQR